MRISARLIIAAAIGLGDVASAQTQGDGSSANKLIPFEKMFRCPDAAVKSKEPVCCRITVTVDAIGKATSATAKCSHPAYETPAVQCELSRPHKPRLRSDGKTEGYTNTDTTTYLPTVPFPPTVANLMAENQEAKKRCEALGGIS